MKSSSGPFSRISPGIHIPSASRGELRGPRGTCPFIAWRSALAVVRVSLSHAGGVKTNEYRRERMCAVSRMYAMTTGFHVTSLSLCSFRIASEGGSGCSKIAVQNIPFSFSNPQRKPNEFQGLPLDIAIRVEQRLDLPFKPKRPYQRQIGSNACRQ